MGGTVRVGMPVGVLYKREDHYGEASGLARDAV